MSDPSTYRERSSAVAGVTVWTRVADGSSSLILPDGCIDVLWNGRELTVAGPDTTAHRARPQYGTPYAALRFASGVAPTVLGFAADGLRDQRPLLADVIGKDDTDRLAESLLATDDPSSELERWAERRLACAGGRDLTMSRVAALISDGRTVAEVAAQGLQPAPAQPSLARRVRLRAEGAGASAAPSERPRLRAQWDVAGSGLPGRRLQRPSPLRPRGARPHRSIGISAGW